MHSDDFQPADSQSRTDLPNIDTDQALGDLLRTLPREQASFGFEDRVLRQARLSPNPPMTFVRGLRLAAPLVVAAALGFVVGPALFEGSQTSNGPTQMAESDSASSDNVLRAPRSVPSVASGPVVNGQVVGGPNMGGARLGGAAPAVGPNGGYRPGISLERIRAETARVRNELNRLRNEQTAAGATVTVMMADGVEVQIDVRDLYEVLQQRAESMEQLQRQAMEQNMASDLDTSSRATEPPPSAEPPLW